MSGEEDCDAGEKFRIAEPSPELRVRWEMRAQVDERLFRNAIRRHPRQPGFAQLERGCRRQQQIYQWFVALQVEEDPVGPRCAGEEGRREQGLEVRLQRRDVQSF